MKLDKQLYKSIKKLNRNEMRIYLEETYKDGFRAGVESGAKVDMRIGLSNILTNTKGIGPKLYAAIMQTEKELR